MTAEALVEFVEDSGLRGCYVAAYAASPQPLEAGYVGYYKIFSGQVGSYFSPGPCLAKGTTRSPAGSPDEAAADALAAGKSELGALLAEAETDNVWVALRYL